MKLHYNLLSMTFPSVPFSFYSNFLIFYFFGGVLSCCILGDIPVERFVLFLPCMTEMQCPLFRTSAHCPGCWFLSAWHKLQSSGQRSFSGGNASPRQPGGKSGVHSFECWLMWKGSCQVILEKVVLGIKENRLNMNKPRQASRYGALLHGFSFSFCLWVPGLSCCLDFPQWWTRSWGL